MGEIKSTIELAMERTRGLVPTREEREKMAQKEHETRARALVRKFLDGDIAGDEIEVKIGELEAGSKGAPWKSLVRRELGNALAPGENHELILPVLGRLGCPEAPELEQRARESVAELERASQTAARRALETLAADGIGGTAVVPNVEADPAWKEESARVRQSFARWRDRVTGWRTP